MTNGNGGEIKLSRTALIAIGLVIPIVIFTASMGASAYDDHEQRIRHLEESAVELRSVKQEIQRQGVVIDRLEEKIDSLKRVR